MTDKEMIQALRGTETAESGQQTKEENKDMKMDVEKRRNELLAILAELAAEIRILSDRVAKAREDLANVYTVDDARRFDENCDLEKGLKHIQLF